MGLGVELKTGKAGSSRIDGSEVFGVLLEGDVDLACELEGVFFDFDLLAGEEDRDGEVDGSLGLALARTMRAGGRKGFLRTFSAVSMIFCLSQLVCWTISSRKP